MRAGYTLLEVILAIAIGLLIVAALYVALDVQQRFMQSGRDLIAESQLARGLLSRVAADVRLSLARLTPPDVETTTESETGTETNPTGDGQVNYGILGNATQMTLFTSTVPRYGRDEAFAATGQSDLRRVTYYHIPGEGLARQEVRLVTALETPEDAVPYLMAEEVVELQFQYYDATRGSWLREWDGTLTGPPWAVEITLGIQPPVDTRMTERVVQPRYYRMVIAVPGAAWVDEETEETEEPL